MSARDEWYELADQLLAKRDRERERVDLELVAELKLSPEGERTLLEFLQSRGRKDVRPAELARQGFLEALREQLEPLGVGLVAANLGRHHGRPVWLVAGELRHGRMVSVSIPVDTPAYGDPSGLARLVAEAIGRATSG